MDTSDIGTSTPGRGRGRRGATTQAQPESRGSVVLGPRDSLVGTLTVFGDVRIEGTVQGEVSATGSVTVHETGSARAQIEARDIVISGILEGSAVAQDLVTIGEAATLTGDVRSARLRVDEGATVNATIVMEASGDAPPARRMEEHNEQPSEEISVDVTGSAVATDSDADSYVDVSAGSESDAYSADRSPETSAVGSGSESDEG